MGEAGEAGVAGITKVRRGGNTRTSDAGVRTTIGVAAAAAGVDG